MWASMFIQGLFFISFSLLITCLLVIIIIYDRKIDTNHEIWISSKLLTLKNVMNINNFNLYPILSFNSNGTSKVYHQNYASLIQHSGKECENDYIKCGILDTYRNIMCIPKNEECPINNMIVDLSLKSNEYLSNGYQFVKLINLSQFVKLINLSEDYLLYYTNKETDKEIIVKMKFSEEIPKIINEDNFIFDEDKYKTEIADEDSSVSRMRNLDEYYGDSEVTKYIKSRFNERINIDRSFKKIYKNIYVGNYIGFKDYSNMNNFNNTDLYESYFTVFPNDAAYFCCYICLIVIFFLVFFQSIFASL